jgi:hypothetical protein
MKLAMVYLAAVLATTGVAGADDPAAVETVVDPKPFALDFSAEVDYYNFDESLVVVTPTIGFTLFEVLDATVALPVYNNTTETGIGNLDFGAEYSIFQNKTGLLWADSSTLSVNGEVGVPLDGAFASDSLTFTLGGAFGLNWGNVGFKQTVSYLFDTSGEIYVPTFGGFIDDSVLNADSSLTLTVSDSFSVGAEFSQNYAGDSKWLSVGPTVDWKVCSAFTLDVGVAFPVVQEDMPYGDNDFTVSAGLGFQF